MTHSREKSNKCSQCDYASSRADTLRRHLKTHSGEKIRFVIIIGKVKKKALSDKKYTEDIGCIHAVALIPLSLSIC